MYYERKLKGTGYCLAAHNHFWVHPENNRKMCDAIMVDDGEAFKKLWSKYDKEEKMTKGTFNYFDTNKLINEFKGEGEFYKDLEKFEIELLSDFIDWLYTEKRYMIIPQ